MELKGSKILTFPWDKRGYFHFKKVYSLFELIYISLLSFIILFNTSNLPTVSTRSKTKKCCIKSLKYTQYNCILSSCLSISKYFFALFILLFVELIKVFAHCIFLTGFYLPIFPVSFFIWFSILTLNSNLPGINTGIPVFFFHFLSHPWPNSLFAYPQPFYFFTLLWWFLCLMDFKHYICNDSSQNPDLSPELPTGMSNCLCDISIWISNNYFNLEYFLFF